MTPQCSATSPLRWLQGSSTKPLAVTSAWYVFEHVSDARIQEIPGAGHAAPLTHSEALAGALAEFFEPVQQPA